MNQFLKVFKPYLLYFIILILFVAGQSYINLTLPDYTARIVNEGVIRQNIATVYSVGVEMLLITLLGGLFTIFAGFLAAKISAGYARRLRDAIFRKIESFSLEEFNTFSSSSLITRTTNDIQQLQGMLMMLMRMTFMAPIMGVGAIIKAWHLAPSMSWIMVYTMGFLILILIFLFLMAIPKFTIIQQVVDRLGLQMREMLSGVRVIRAYNKDEIIHKKFANINMESTKLNIFVGRLMSLIQPTMTLAMGVASIAVVWAGAYLVDSGDLNIGHIVALMQYISQAIMSFFMISIVFIMIPRAVVSAKRINEVLSIMPKIQDPENPKHLKAPVQGIIEFCDVSFSYEGSEKPVLSGISFVARPGEITAIIGSTGSGKSTLLNLIPRLYDVTVGSITLDGVDIRHIAQHELHEQIGYIPQKVMLFSGTVRDNVCYGIPIADEGELKKAIELSKSTDFIANLSDGIDSVVAQGGNNFSGGQKQRLSIARAIVKKSPVILFDDSFSALDYKTDAAIRKSLETELKSSNIIIVAQRISTIMHADNIIVMDNGRIVAQGKHKELLKSCPVYREIAVSQLTVEELKQNV